MNKKAIINIINMHCPICDKFHDVEEKVHKTQTIIKGEEITYEEHYYYCCNGDEDECVFMPGKMADENLMNARNAYREKHGLLSSDEIIAIREKYGLSQVDLAKLLGWGEATISRYESKAIQDEAYDSILRIINEYPAIALDFLNKNGCKFSDDKRQSIKQKILMHLDENSLHYLQKKSSEICV